jgi:hypothetical protein
MPSGGRQRCTDRRGASSPRRASSSRPPPRERQDVRCIGSRAARHSPVPGEISLTDLCEPPDSRGPAKLNGRAFALDGTDDLSVAGPGRLRGDAPRGHLRWLRHSATVSNLQRRSSCVCGPRAGERLAVRHWRAIGAAYRNAEPGGSLRPAPNRHRCSRPVSGDSPAKQLSLRRSNLL